MTCDTTVYTAFDLPISDNEVDPPVPGARLYHHGRSYEFIAKQWWTSGGYYRYTVRLRTHLRLIPPPNPGGGGGG